jgi:RecB family endonuclease NucS
MRTDVYFRTPFGARFVDIVGSNADGDMVFIEVKLGGSRYSVLQQLKDEWLYEEWGIPTKLMRIPR